MSRERLHTIIRRIIAQIKNERSLSKITSELCDRLALKNRTISSTERANAAYFLAMMPFTEKLFNTLYEKAHAWKDSLDMSNYCLNELDKEIRISFLRIEEKIRLLTSNCNLPTKEALVRRFKHFSYLVREDLT